MKKIFTGVIFLLFVTSALPARQGHCKTQTPEQLVRNFYAWYFEADKGSVAAENKDEIYKYVAWRTVKYIKENPPANISYFAKANTFGSMGWENPTIIVGESIPMGGDVFVAPVTFKLNYESYRKNISVVVFVKNENKHLYITKVVDIYPYF